MNRVRTGYEHRTDTDLIRRARSDPAAFKALYERHASTMQQWLYAQVQDKATACELLAETWAVAWLERTRFRGRSDRAGAAWLYQLAREQVRRYRRDLCVETKARQRLQMRSVEADDGELDEIPERLDAAKLSPAVREAFQELTWEQQQIIGYRVIAGLTYEEMANELGISQTTARTRVRAALAALRRVVKGATS